MTFSVSSGQLRKETGAPNLKVSIYLAQFTYLGLIRRLPLYELDAKRYGAMMSYLRQ